MDKWKYYDITHREHVLCNPISIEKLEQLIALLRLGSGAQVLDIAMGKGEFLIRLAERYHIGGVGVDLSPYCIADAERKRRERVPDARLQFLKMDGAAYEPGTPESFDVASCIGASWIYQGHRGTLKALIGMAAQRSWVVVGEPFWRQEPAEAYLSATGDKRSDFGTHYENAMAGRDLGLTLAYTLVSSQDDWDNYEGLQWYAANAWASQHPGDPDAEEVLERVREGKDAYLRWGRDTLGWAIYVFKKGGW